MRRFAAGVVVAVTLAACGGSDDASTEVEENDATTTTVAALDESSTEDVTDDSAETDDAAADEGASSDLGGDEGSAGSEDQLVNNCSTRQAPNPEQVYSVSNIPANDPDGGLVARLSPGTNGEAINVLPEGTIVEIFENDLCVVLESGSVWWFINTPMLATGGFVNSSFLAGQSDLGQETDGNAQGGGEEDFDVALAQVDCVYFDGLASCDLLVQYLIGTVDDNYGLGNTYSMAPSGFLAEDCLFTSDPIACAELGARGPGGDLEAIATAYITAYQAGDLATQQALSGERNTGTNQSPIPAEDGFGLVSANFYDNDFSWDYQPTSNVVCIVADGLVQQCSFKGS